MQTTAIWARQLLGGHRWLLWAFLASDQARPSGRRGRRGRRGLLELAGYARVMASVQQPHSSCCHGKCEPTGVRICQFCGSLRAPRKRVYS